ncbi:geranylgeranylglyceryl/heptaprenylglyceryl phosphate synthase [Flavivirga abyssicola]|uniref:geranylgeranylglyceryl/heptaprenylglyceryl phosphate synthase n=1 Tax=Flavivirga abyssicola TaxID=3063533 RepID=UPI0026DF1400|nr:geranylgeranylglyceryl/heptaprenylglyceryl phosphate synthase [Flavivirga sp. MEBiC07777]WVK14471.1 geranylgeranylglyceryl/heptaprenylglyceryl phosphate synthase [Flavivirga sp. MEBiC07777]
MKHIYNDILASISKGEKLLAVLIDPDKIKFEKVSSFIEKVNTSIATHIFVGGSTVNENITDTLVEEIKRYTKTPIVLFPGGITQITGKADAILFLSLISGRNPEYLIGKHIRSISKLNETNLDVISTGYILIEGGKETAVERVTETAPLSRTNIQHIVDTAKAGELLGMKLIYLEAGSGAKFPVSKEIMLNVKKAINIPLIVGGGIRSKKQLENAYNFGADLVVIGTAFEEDESFFDELKAPSSVGHFPKKGK